MPPQTPQTGPQIPPLPSPTGAPTTGPGAPNPGVIASPGMSQEEMKSNLQKMMGVITSKFQDFNARHFALQNQDKAQNAAALRQVFSMFSNMGIDPGDPAQLKQLLTTLQQKSPELYQQMEQALETLLGGGGLKDTAQTAGTTPAATQSMNIPTDETLS